MDFADIEKTLSVISRQIDNLQKHLESVDVFFSPVLVLNPPSQYEIDLWNYKPKKQTIKILHPLATPIEAESLDTP